MFWKKKENEKGDKDVLLSLNCPFRFLMPLSTGSKVKGHVQTSRSEMGLIDVCTDGCVWMCVCVRACV